MKKCLWGLLSVLLFAACGGPVTVNENGMIIKLSDGSRVRVEAVSDQIIHVSAVPCGKFSTRESLPVLPWEGIPATVELTPAEAILSTAALKAKVDLASGVVTIVDLEDNVLLQEHSRSFEKIKVGSDKGWSLQQSFESPDDEAFYGLGQHQSDEFNYKGKNETLYQYNTKVSVPFIVSSRGYGLLWDNYSLTRWGDPRDYSQLNEAFSLESLEATYTAADGTVLSRSEDYLDYSDLDKVNNFPSEFLPKFYGSTIVWEGSLTALESGLYHFILYYAGYTTVYVDGQEIVPEHWRTAWNPNSVKFALEMEEGSQHSVKVVWQPDGGVSYISLKALTPVDPEVQARQSWWSEMGDQIDYYFVWGGAADAQGACDGASCSQGAFGAATISDKVIAGYRALTGRSQIMPKWVMGYWQSRERYKTTDEIVGALKELRAHGFGVDNMVIDWSHWVEDSWGSLEFDLERFPDPQAMMDALHEDNAHVMISVWPKFYHTTEHFKEYCQIGAMYMRAVEDSIRDWIGQGYIGSFYDAYNPEARKLFWNQMNEHLFSLGMDAWWMDASEPDILSNSSLEYRKALSGPTYLGSSTRYLNTYSLVNAMAIYDGQRSVAPNQRVFLLTRSGFAGLQRYSTATWSGDIGTCWEDMKAQISAGINFSLSGIPYWSQDIGGFCVQKKFEIAREGDEAMEEWRELNARWHQWGAFTPMYRSHGQYPFREPYNIAPASHPAYKSILAVNKLRYRLMPYIYSLAAQTWLSDYTIMRGLVMDFGADPVALDISDEYMFGPSFLVCPVYTYGTRAREVYLPNGAAWYDYYSGKYYVGGTTLTAAAPYDRSPLYVRAGTIVPMGPVVTYALEPTDGSLDIWVYTGADAHFTLYEDDGLSYGYENGEYAVIPLSWNEAAKTLKVGERSGSFEGMISDRALTVHIVSPAGTRVVKAAYNGAEISVK